MNPWEQACVQISAADYKKHQTRLQKWRNAYRAAQILPKDSGGCERIIAIDESVGSGECHAFARAILTEDYEYEAHLSDSDFFNRVAPFVAAYPPSFEQNWPKHFELAKEFALLELVGEMSKRGTHFETLGNVDFDTGEVIYYNLNSSDLEVKIHSLFPDFAFPKKLEICGKCTEADDCQACFDKYKNEGTKTFEDERVFRRDVRNAYILRDLETMRFLLKE
jgi:hypothetical protein